MAARQNYYAESLAESSTSSTTYVDKVALTFTPDANSTYFIIASYLKTDKATIGTPYARFIRTSETATTFNEDLREVTSANSGAYYTSGGIGVDTFGSSPSSQTYKLQFMQTNSLGRAYMKGARIIAIKASGNDQYSESTAESSTTSTTYVDKTTLTFTPEAQGDYVILAAFDIKSSGSLVKVYVDLNINDTSYSETYLDGIDYSTQCFIKIINLPANPNTIKLRYKTEGTNTAYIKNARILALRADTFDAVSYSEDNSPSSTTSTAYQTKLTHTYQPNSVAYLYLFSAFLTASTSSYFAYAKAQFDTTNYEELAIQASSTTSQFSYFLIDKKTPTAASHDWKIAYRSSGTLVSVTIDDARIALIQLDASPSPPPVNQPPPQKFEVISY